MNDDDGADPSAENMSDNARWEWVAETANNALSAVTSPARPPTCQCEVYLKTFQFAKCCSRCSWTHTLMKVREMSFRSQQAVAAWVAGWVAFAVRTAATFSSGNTKLISSSARSYDWGVSTCKDQHVDIYIPT